MSHDVFKQATDKLKQWTHKAIQKYKNAFADQAQIRIAIEKMKKDAAIAALDFVEEGMIIGVGTGSTADYFIEALKSVKHKIEGVVASSEATALKIKALSIPLLDFNSVDKLPLYVDGADEVGPYKRLIKGGGGALTREKILAYAAEKFICIVDETKRVDILGAFPVPVEVIPLSRSYVARKLIVLGGDPVYRKGFTTDNGHVILDVYNLKLLDPAGSEREINQITGVVENGIFAVRTADIVLVGTPQGVESF